MTISTFVFGQTANNLYVVAIVFFNPQRFFFGRLIIAVNRKAGQNLKTLRAQISDKLKELMGEEYNDFNLVLALETGRPCEDRVIGNQFERLKRSAGLPDVVFHSLRHSSTTYKLKINHGDIKATQGDTGHAQATMVTEVYAHIIDEERKINAQKFETAFYANPDMRIVERQLQPPIHKQAPEFDLQQLLTQLKENPELANQLKAFLHAG